MNISNGSLKFPASKIKYYILKGNYINYPVYETNFNGIHYALKGSFNVTSDLYKQSLEVPEGSFIIVKNSTSYLLNNTTVYDSIIVNFLVDNQYFQELTNGTWLKTFTVDSKINLSLFKTKSDTGNHRQYISKQCYKLIENNDVTALNLNNIVSDMLRYAEPFDTSKPAAAKPMIEDILEFIRSNPSIVNLKVLSQRYSYSISYISELIHQETGLTFSQTLKSIRMAKSLELLKTTDKTVNEISESVGYSTTPGFIVAFQEMYNMTPTEYRRNNANLN